jgi:putative transcriptional regulator
MEASSSDCGKGREEIQSSCTHTRPFLAALVSYIFNMSSPSLHGSLLLANPQMQDPNFSRSVVYLVGHAADRGALGYVLNKPLGRSFGEEFSELATDALRSVPVFMGGPVGKDQLTFAALRWSRSRDAVILKHQLTMEEAAHQLALGREVRAFIGHSGWGPLQLEGEILQRSWILTYPPKSVLTTNPDEALWTHVLESMGPEFGLLTQIPPSPELN